MWAARTPLEYAVVQKQLEAARLLLTNHVNVNAKNGHQESISPLHTTASAGHSELAQLLDLPRFVHSPSSPVLERDLVGEAPVWAAPRKIERGRGRERSLDRSALDQRLVGRRLSAPSPALSCRLRFFKLVTEPH